jgi:DNA-binding Xre family transcriptional regulator
MAIRWDLKHWLAAERRIYRPSELQPVLAERGGLHLSLQAISTLMNRRPDAIRFRTMQALCRALDCKLSDFCEISPDADPMSEAQAAGARRKHQAGGKKKRVSRQRRLQIVFPELPERLGGSSKRS